jgi:CDGSH-type Zn-finger protein
MARIVRLTSLKPLKIETKDLPVGKPLSICTCGLSQTFPLCDGSHKVAREIEKPGMLYTYDVTRTRIVGEAVDPDYVPPADGV